MKNAITVEVALQLAHALKQQLAQQLEIQNLDITPMHVRVIMTIHKRQHCTAQDIVNLFKRDKAQINRLIKGLIDQGLVKKTVNPNDKRSQLLTLSAQGKDVQKTLFECAGEIQEKVTFGVNTDDLDIFVKVAQQMTKNLTS